MNTEKIYSPLYKTRQTLRFLRWTLGFPLQIKGDSYTEFRYVTGIESIRLLTVFLIFGSSYLFWIILHLIYEGNLNNFSNVLEEAFQGVSLSRVDQILSALVTIIVMVQSFSYLLCFKYNTEYISVFCKELCIVKSKVSEITRRKGRKNNHCCKLQNSEKTLLYGQLINLVVSVLFGIWCYLLVQSNFNQIEFSVRYGPSFQVVYPILFAIQIFIILYGPLCCAAELVACQLINSLSGLFEDWIELMKWDQGLHQINNCGDKEYHRPKSLIDVELCSM